MEDLYVEEEKHDVLLGIIKNVLDNLSRTSQCSKLYLQASTTIDPITTPTPKSSKIVIYPPEVDMYNILMMMKKKRLQVISKAPNTTAITIHQCNKKEKKKSEKKKKMNKTLNAIEK